MHPLNIRCEIFERDFLLEQILGKFFHFVKKREYLPYY
ncbi:hypothetical protein BSM4216_3177 [Bacillus smithii]|nr:hypothetical protein BSM4216_3177 [Bacillus smithii]